MRHIVLLGDSVFDNGVYVDPGEPDVAEQLDSLLPEADEVTLLAIDGHLTRDVSSQLEDLPESATHLFVSVGGNDALSYLNVLESFEKPVSTVFEAVDELKYIQDEFLEEYSQMISEVLDCDLPTAICTIYNGNFQDQELQEAVDTILPVINDVIVDSATKNNLPLMDLGRICDERRDYANPIEPSAHGGEKIAKTIVDVLEKHSFRSGQTEIFAGR